MTVPFRFGPFRGRNGLIGRRQSAGIEARPRCTFWSSSFRSSSRAKTTRFWPEDERRRTFLVVVFEDFQECPRHWGIWSAGFGSTHREIPQSARSSGGLLCRIAKDRRQPHSPPGEAPAAGS